LGKHLVKQFYIRKTPRKKVKKVKEPQDRLIF